MNGFLCRPAESRIQDYEYRIMNTGLRKVILSFEIISFTRIHLIYIVGQLVKVGVFVALWALLL
ncbi:hypothetical protein [Methanosarcina sp. Kolksee]|uniref:hypothetical protein n=1 Tax=Methanosarcina sp. Kolksee TaxID=1434099 RepID=UPI001E3C477E|nr:hypothetical protein [Methanosarcina sp. Kolksee]